MASGVAPGHGGGPVLLNLEIRTAFLNSRHQWGEVPAQALQHLRWNRCGGLTGVHPMAQIGDLLRDAEMPAQLPMVAAVNRVSYRPMKISDSASPPRSASRVAG